MQHIINIAFDFDDDKIRSIAEGKCKTAMDEIIKEIVLDRMAPNEYNFYSRKNERNWEHLYSMVHSHIDSFIEEHKEEILERAAGKIADSLKRTKAWKERYTEEIQK